MIPKNKFWMITAFLVLGAFSSWGQTLEAGWTMDKKDGIYVYTRPELKGMELQVQRFNDPSSEPNELFQNQILEVSKKCGCPDLELVSPDQKNKREKKWQFLAKSSGKTYPTCFLVGGSSAENSILTVMVLITDDSTKNKKDEVVSESIQKMIDGFIINEGLANFAKKSGKPLPVPKIKDYSRTIPLANKPVSILEYWSNLAGSKYVLLFKDGQTTQCSDWDAGFFSVNSVLLPASCLSGKWKTNNIENLSNIEIQRYPNWIPAKNYLKGYNLSSSRFQPFEKGEKIDLTLVSNESIAAKIKSGSLNASSLEKWEAIFTKDGKFYLGHLESSSIPNPKRKPNNYKNPASGVYYFDGYNVTLVLETGYNKGHIVRGFTGWIDETTRKSKSILVNNQKFIISKNL